jgi:hypothetical protein
MSSWDALTGHARQHHATIGVSAAADLGIPSSSLITWCEQGRLLQPAPETYVIAGSPETWHQR